MSKEKVSVDSLNPPDWKGFMTKQGGSYKSWKRRWFVLKGNNLYYFKSPKDSEQTGVIELERDSFVKEDSSTKKKHCFSVSTSRRTFFMHPDTENEKREWMEKLTKSLDRLKGIDHSPAPTISNPPVNTYQQPTPQPVVTQPEVYHQPSNPTPSGGGYGAGGGYDSSYPVGNIPSQMAGSSANIRERLAQASNVVSFLGGDPESRVGEFWDIWSQSIPTKEEAQQFGSVIFQVSASSDMEKLTWRTSGPQSAFIQKMVDFFWNVGAPDSEIDRLNDVGALINPMTIGSWIDMSGKGGMDGGWFFPVDIPIKFALEASDPGDPVTRLTDWAELNGVTRCTAVGRDMGAAPPRQTEIRFLLPGSTFEQQLQIGLSAYEAFEFPPLPDEMLNIIREHPSIGLSMSVITSQDGFVRLGLLCPVPGQATIQQLCTMNGVPDMSQLNRFISALGVAGPAWVEYQFLNTGFGYGVYKEGFDVVFHFDLGEEI